MNTKIENFLNTVMEEYDLPGIAVGLSIGRDSFCSSRGLRNYLCKGSPEASPLQADDIFHCASVSKLFTASAILKLVEAGAFGLYDRLCNILPELEIADERYKEIRLWNMLSHTSGLGDVDDYHWEQAQTAEDALENYVLHDPESTDQPMLWDPQTAPEFYGALSEGENYFRYSNLAYEIMGHIVSRYSDRMPSGKRLSYEDFVAEYLMKPAGMSDSTMKTFVREGWASRPEEISGERLAYPHEKAADRSIVLSEYYPYTRQHGPSSTLTSCVRDLLSWGRAHMKSAAGTEESLLQKDTYDSIWRDYATVPNNGEKMGLGWFMRKQKITDADGNVREYQLMGHEGTDDGFRASFWICPELEMTTVVLSNLSGAPVKKINKRLFEAVVK